jgi:nicotinamide-nucleotide amidase
VKQRAPVVEAIAVGNEILSGDILDTNFQYMARELRDLGIDVARHLTVPDVKERIAAQVTESLGRADVVLVTGGLGPTADDTTRYGVADALGLELHKDPDTVEGIRERFRRFGIADMAVANEVQALFPEGSAILDNPNGTAAGFRTETDDGRAVFVLPGPPRELRPMFGRHVAPWLEANRRLPVIAVRRLRTLGIGESMLAESVAAWPFGIQGVDLGYYPQDPGVDLKVTARGSDRAAVNAAADRAVGRLRDILGEHVYAAERISIGRVVGDLLLARKSTLSLAESCTGGLAGSLVTDTPGASAWFDASIVTYSYDAKEKLLGIPRALLESKGAVSEEVARAMAEAVRNLRGTDYGVGITGIAGPDGGSAEKPVGLVYIAVSDRNGTDSFRTSHAGERVTIQRRAAVTALDLLRRRLLRTGGPT